MMTRTIGLSIVLLLGAGACRDDQVKAPTDLSREPMTAVEGPGAVRYQLDLSERHRNRLRVRARFPTAGKSRLIVMLPVWTPGSYLVREYARHIESISARPSPGQGEALRVEKIAKNRFAIETKGNAAVAVDYLLYAREATVRTNFVDAEYAIINGAAAFLTDPEALQATHSVTLALPAKWTAETSLSRVETATSATFLASDYEALVDAPILMGTLESIRFDVAGRAHWLVNTSTAGPFSDEATVEDVKKIVQTTANLWGGELPYREYRFLNVVNEARGGLEHRDSTVLMTTRFIQRDTKKYQDWLGLVSHEFFHTWNGKRLRPHNLGPFDWEHEVYTKDLWIVEGLTSYYDDLILLRAGLMTEVEWLERLSNGIKRLDETHGRKLQSLNESSYDAWIKFYRANASSWNSTVSYYRKGAIVAFILDMAIRKETRGRRSLDDVMRTASARFSTDEGYTTAGFLDVFTEVGAPKARALAVRLTGTTEALDYSAALRWLGLEFEAPKASDTGYLGVTVGASHGRLIVKKVAAGSPAERAGLNVDDELIAVDNLRIADKLDDVLEGRKSGDSLRVTIARRRQILTLNPKLGARPAARGKVQRLETPSPAQKRSWKHFIKQ